MKTLTTRRHTVARVVLLAAVFAASGCGFEQFIFEELTRGDQVELPPTAPNILEGSAPSQSGGTVAVYAGGGTLLESVTASIEADGRFRVTLPGNTEFVNLVLVAGGQSGTRWGLAPQVAAQTRVTDPARILPMDFLQPQMATLDANTTTAVLLVLAKARVSGLPISSLAPGATSAAITEILALNGSDMRVTTFSEMVSRVIDSDALRPFPPAGESYLQADALTGIDYTGDGTGDTDSGAFDQALAAAIGAFEFNACYPDDRIRLVLMADMGGGLDRNCAAIDTFRWAEDEAGKSVFVTGGIHKDTPRCGDAAPPCLDDATVDAASQLLGNWEPNQIRMYDDGTHGDAVSGDNVWTLTVDMPWFPLADAASPGVRIGYKYTFGFPGQGWTGSEEWPGNKRVLELRDLNGDHLVTRYDHFGDETTNKDKANLLSPAKGGCGTVVFPSQVTRQSCTYDAVENRIDTDGDCELDALPTPGVAAPLTIECP